MDRFEHNEQRALLPVGEYPYRRLGARKNPGARHPLPVSANVERRSFRVYGEAVS